MHRARGGRPGLCRVRQGVACERFRRTTAPAAGAAMPLPLSRALVIGAAVLATGAAPILLDVGRPELERVMALARGPEQERAKFHARYQVPTSDPSLERLDVITEYRRVLVVIGQRLAAGDFAFATNTRLVEDAMRPWKRKVTVRARIRFNPHNVYREMPRVSLVLGKQPQPLVPIHVTTEPQYALGNYAAGSAPLIGVAIDSDFNAAVIGQRQLPVVIHIPGAADVNVPIDFSKMP